MLPDNTYVVAHAFMVNELGLKGKELWVYATIYGFSQDGDSWFSGAQSFIAEWADCSPRWVRKILASLEARGLIEKRVQRVQGKTFNEYRINPAELSSAGRNSVPKPEELSSANNNKYIYRDNNKPPIVPLERGEEDGYDPIRDVIDHLNARSGKSFKADTKATRGMLHARMEEGYSVDIIKRVIDLKVGQWSKSPKMRAFIRPSTLFSKTNFENYANELGPISDYSKYDGVVDEVIGGGL